MSEASHVEGLIPCERSTLWVYFFSQIFYHNKLAKGEKKCRHKKSLSSEKGSYFVIASKTVQKLQNIHFIYRL